MCFDDSCLLLFQLLDLLEQQPLVQGSLVLLFEQDLLDDLQVLGLGDDVLEVRLPSLLLLRPRLGLPQARGEGLSLLDEAIIVSIFEVIHLSCSHAWYLWRITTVDVCQNAKSICTFGKDLAYVIGACGS